MCNECSSAECKGVGELRRFADWNDLASHLSEEDIVRLINHLYDKSEEWERVIETERLKERLQRHSTTLALANFYIEGRKY